VIAGLIDQRLRRAAAAEFSPIREKFKAVLFVRRV
jgi:hypothetical protein